MELSTWSKLATKPKHKEVKWLFLKIWGKIIKTIKPDGAKQKFTISVLYWSRV
ncbi:hypothetical protein Hanom_Chr11g01006531 [Helianthus anomalus]